MVVFYHVHARVLKTLSREDVIPGLTECIRLVTIPSLSPAESPTMVFLHQHKFICRRSAEGGGDVTRVKADLWNHLTPLIDPFYLEGRGLVFSLLSAL